MFNDFIITCKCHVICVELKLTISDSIIWSKCHISKPQWLYHIAYVVVFVYLS